MAWCEQSGVDFMFGLARNARLEAMIEPGLLLAHAVSMEEREGAPVRAYRELRYRTRDSWTCERRVVAKAEWLLSLSAAPPVRELFAHIAQQLLCVPAASS